MATKNGVGIWQHYRTNETPKADGLAFSGEVLGYKVESHLFWKEVEGGRRANCFVVVTLDDGNETRSWDWLSEVRPRRSWDELRKIGAANGIEFIEDLVFDAVCKHKAFVEAGFIPSNGFYTFPQGVDAAEAKRLANEAYQRLISERAA